MDEPDSNRWPTACAAARPLSFRPLAQTPFRALGIRHGSAARTGWAMKPTPLWTVRGACALAPRRRRQCVCDCIRRRPHRSIKVQRVHAPARLSLPRASNARMLRERDAIAFDRAVDPLRTPETKRPRVLEPEGVRVASGDRGDRSPRCEGSVDAGGAVGVPLAAFGQQRIVPFARAQSRIALGQ